MRKFFLYSFSLLLISLVACNEVSPEQQAAEAAKSYYDQLVEGYAEGFLEGKAGVDSLPADYPVYGTLLDGDDIYQQPLSDHGLIVMGNEGNGISEAVRSRVNRRLLIPSFRQGDTAESLNVAIATAITCSEFRRRV